MNMFMKTEWKLTRNCFMSSPPQRDWLDRVFTGREEELSRAIRVVGDAPRRLLINGLFGVGKTILIKEISRQLEDSQFDFLVVNEWLYSQDCDIGLVILRGLSEALKDESPYAREVYECYIGQQVSRKEDEQMLGELSSGIPKFLSQKTSRSSNLQKQTILNGIPDPIPAVRKLLRDAKERVPNRHIVITVDDLDKRDPETVRKLLTSSRDLLHNPACSYVLTGHPLGVMRDAYSSAGGIIDHSIDLAVMSGTMLRLMIAKYLAAGRVVNWRFWGRPVIDSNDVSEEALLPFRDECVEKIIARSYGIPRVMNIICFNILEEAASRKIRRIGLSELDTCWSACAHQLRQGIRPDLRNLLETLTNRGSGIDVNELPDDLYSDLQVDTHEELLSKLDFALQHDLLISRNGSDLHLNSLLVSFDDHDNDPHLR